MSNDDADRAARALARTQDDVITRRQARACGLTDAAIAHRLARDGWSLPVRGVVTVPPVTDPVRTAARAAVIAAGPGVAVSHGSAALLHGFPFVPRARGLAGVDLTLPPAARRAQPRGLRLHWPRLGPDEIADSAGIRLTDVPRTALDLVVDCGVVGCRDEAVALLDSLLNAGLLAPDELLSLRRRAETARRPGAGRAAPWWALTDGRAQSPLESRVRLALVDAGLAPEEVQHRVVGSEGWIATVDLAWPSRRLVVEVDGRAWHSDRQTFTWDRRRQNALLDAGWSCVRFSADDLRHPSYVVQEVRRGLARGRTRAA